MSLERHWRPGIIGASIAVLIGLLFGQPEFLLVATIPLGYTAYGHMSGVSQSSVAVRRAVSDSQPRPGEDVTVTLTVENTGESPIADLELADAPPAGVPIDGTPELATSLQPGGTATSEYTLNFPRGVHEFGDVTIRRQNLAGTAAETEQVSAGGIEEVTCHTLLDSVPLREQTIQYVGRSPSDSAGSGVEFFGTREYHRGDPIGQIDWGRYARTGELTTVQLREHRSMIIMFVIDDRSAVQRSRPAYGPDSHDLSVYAVSRAIPTLLDDNHRVGVALLSALDTQTGDGYVSPGGGKTTKSTTQTMLKDTEAVRQRLSGDQAAQRLATRAPANAQVVFCTPLVDDFAIEFADVLRQRRFALSVLSPDMAPAEGTLGSATAAARRDARIAMLEKRGVPVVNWSLDTPLARALGSVFETWGRKL